MSEGMLLMKRLLVFMLMIATALLFSACGGSGSAASDTSNEPSQFEAGEYDGDLDENGKRSGQGVWICDNFRYEGEWKNDMPNGRGTLFRSNSETGTGKAVAFVTQAQWVDGYAEGDVEYGFLYEDGKSTMWEFFVFEGRPPVEILISLKDGPSLVVDNDDLYAVPPFAPEVETDSTVPAPTREQAQEFYRNKKF